MLRKLSSKIQQITWSTFQTLENLIFNTNKQFQPLFFHTLNVWNNNNNNNNPKCCRNTTNISLATQVFKSLNEIPHFQTAPADPMVHLICHVHPLFFSSSLSLTLKLLFSHWAGISWTSVLGKHSSSTSTARAPWRTRGDVGTEVRWKGGREGRTDGEQKTREWKGIEEEGKILTPHTEPHSNENSERQQYGIGAAGFECVCKQ